MLSLRQPGMRQICVLASRLVWRFETEKNDICLGRVQLFGAKAFLFASRQRYKRDRQGLFLGVIDGVHRVLFANRLGVHN